MIWRHLLLLAVVPVGAVLVVGSLFPKGMPDHWQDADRAAAQVEHDADFSRTLTALNAAFTDHWQTLGIKPAPRADDLTILRRLSLGLTGTIPSLEEIRMVQRMQAQAGGKDTHAKFDAIELGTIKFDAIAWWTAGLLADPRSSDYLGERFARSFVGTIDGPFLIYRRRRFVTWLADELHANRPYDQIVRKLMASDGLWTSEPATNFVTVTVNAGMEGKGPDETKLAARVYRAFLGIRIDCAQCHDHPFASWKQEDFHNLAAFFAHTEQSITGIREGQSNYVWVKHQPSTQPARQVDSPTPEDDAPADASPNEMLEQAKLLAGDPHARVGTPGVPFYPELLSQHGNRREQLAAWVTDPQNKAFARATVNRVWALMFGRAVLDPVDDIPFEAPTDASDPQYFGMRVLDLLAHDFAAHGFDLRRLIQLIAQSEPFQREAYEDPAWSDEQLETVLDAWATFQVSRLRPEQVSGAIIQSASVQTIDRQSHVVFRLQRLLNESEFVKRYGDAGEDELLFHNGTIPQRLLMLCGEQVKDRTQPNPVLNASAHVAMLAPDDKAALEAAYLAVLTRLPTEDESRNYLPRLKGTTGARRQAILEDIYATLLNDWQASWNH
jgi:hypothetical protein